MSAAPRRGPLWRPVAAGAAAAFVVAGFGGSLTEIAGWYRSLEFPSWKPPDWLFGPAWTTIFALCVVSGVHAWRRAPNRAAREWIIGLFALNGALNIGWSLLFFRLRRPDWALYETAALWASILLLIVVLARWSRLSAWLLAPYLAWVSFAAALNWEIVRLNAPFG